MRTTVVVRKRYTPFVIREKTYGYKQLCIQIVRISYTRHQIYASKLSDKI
jgi:hypothetical protein